MHSIIKLYSNIDGEICRFLSEFYENDKYKSTDLHSLEWEKVYINPVEIATILGVFIDNSDKFNVNMWISLDKDVFINVTSDNANEIIKYLYERYPY